MTTGPPRPQACKTVAPTVTLEVTTKLGFKTAGTGGGFSPPRPMARTAPASPGACKSWGCGLKQGRQTGHSCPPAALRPGVAPSPTVPVKMWYKPLKATWGERRTRRAAQTGEEKAAHLSRVALRYGVQIVVLNSISV